MSWLQKAVKRRALKQSTDAIKMVEQAKKNGLMKPDVADGLIKQLKASIEGAKNEEQK